MKTGKTLSQLAAEIERQSETKKDYVATTGKGVDFTLDLTGRPHKDDGADRYNPNFGKPAIVLENTGRFPLSPIAHEQVAETVGIPKKYYDRMLLEAPELLVDNVRTWFKKKPEARMVRTLDNRARAFLSDKFQPLDNHDFANATLPLLNDRKLEIVSCEITEKRLYIKAIDTRLFRDVPVGHKMGDGTHTFFDTCAPAIILSNSEVGFGRLVVETGVYTKACTNLALFAKGGMKRTHVGARHRLTEGMDVADLDSIMSSLTKRKTMEALWLQVRDVVASAFDEKVIGKRLDQIAATAGVQITGKVEKVVEVTAKHFDLSDVERESVLKHLIQGRSLSQYGLHAAITRAAQDLEDYDRATDLEYIGGRVIELPRQDFARLAEAA